VTQAPSGDSIPQRTLDHLEWARLQDAVLARCRGASARRAGLSFADGLPATRALLAQTGEAAKLLAAGEALPLDDLRDLQAQLDRIERGGVLDPAALADVRVTLQNARSLRRFLGARRSTLPALQAAAPLDPSLDELEAQLGHAISVEGTMLDDASEELRRVRSEINALRERIAGRLQDVIDKHADLLSDRYYTLRDGRYVLPVRSDAHDRLPGIVHGASASGASVFVEPRAVVAHGNRLKMAEAEREREEARILAALSELVRNRLPELRGAAAALDLLDLRNAAAQFGREIGAIVPELAPGPRLRLRAARHPLLALAGATVVANDVELEAGRGLVISGPNAGGKTVVLKTLGLCALMVRCGLPLPVAEGSSVGYFAAVHCELGDEQSTATNLSTFSAHVRNLARILERADARSLVLLDEVATGTDPVEGAALACAVVDALCTQGAALAVTTHYEALKAFALRDPRLRSASVGLDAERMEPTFQLLLDVPGASSALLVARRFGLPAHVVDQALERLPQQARDFEQLVAQLAQAANAVRQERAAVAEERAALTRERADYEGRMAQLREQSKHRLSKEADKLMSELRQARDELDQARKGLRQEDRKPQELSALQKQVGEIAGRVGAGSELAAALSLEPLEVVRAPASIELGARVYVPRLRSEAVVVELGQKGKVLVAVGAMKLWVDGAELRTPAAKPAEAPAPTRLPRVPEAPIGRFADNTLDVRGLRADDAVAMLGAFIDRLYATPARVGYVLHGHGTGALRNVVREHLKVAQPYVQDSQAASVEEGGDAVTVFVLR
jgi:DNA mismatch repair protein MutS2